MDAEVLGTSDTPQSMAELYRRHAAGAGRLAYFLVGDKELAEDLVHDAFVRVLGRWGDVRKRSAFTAYLNRTIVNLSKKHYRRKSVERAYLQREGHLAAPAAVPAPDPAERDELWMALQSLPHRQRAAVVLRYFGDMSEHQAAEVMECSPAAINSLVARALDALRSSIPDLGV